MNVDERRSCFRSSALAAPSCETILTERDEHGVFVNRNTLPATVHHETLMNELINTAPPGRPVMIYDTNPNPRCGAT